MQTRAFPVRWSFCIPARVCLRVRVRGALMERTLPEACLRKA